MSVLTVKDRPGRVGEVSADRADNPSAALGIRERGRLVPTCDGVVSRTSLLEPNGDTIGEKGGDECSVGDATCMGEMGLLRGCGGGVADENRGED